MLRKRITDAVRKFNHNTLLGLVRLANYKVANDPPFVTAAPRMNDYTQMQQ